MPSLWRRPKAGLIPDVVINCTSTGIPFGNTRPVRIRHLAVDLFGCRRSHGAANVAVRADLVGTCGIECGWVRHWWEAI